MSLIHILPANAFSVSVITAAALTIIFVLVFPIAARFAVRLCAFIAGTVGGHELKRADEEGEGRPDTGHDMDEYPNISAQCKDFEDNITLCKQLYYGTRFAAGLSAGFLPFLISPHLTVSVVLSCCIVVAIVVDRVCAPVKNLELNEVAVCKVRELKSAGLDKVAFAKAFSDIMATFRKGYLEQLAQLQFAMQKIDINTK